jgi:hypothetical protein
VSVVFFDFSEEIVSVHISQFEVAENYLWLYLLENFEGRFAVGCFDYFKVVFLQIPGEEKAHVTIIVNNQYFLHSVV